jgi:predicted transglutaminase-like cysteine proteinase
MTGLGKAILQFCCLSVCGMVIAFPAAASEQATFIATGPVARAPIGWVEFCVERPAECEAGTPTRREVALNARSWRELVRINATVNEQIKPITDQEHHGVLEKWTYPDDGYGDCEDYVLLKRRMLMAAGWPRHTLLITVVRDQKGDGHAVLTVKTDKGEFILDNQNAEILPWWETSYRYVKRQSQGNPNIWVSLGDPRPAHATASSQ